jgi:CRP-like cAMP-binding protein
MRSAFGDLALLHHAPRAATVRATASCRLWAMQRDVYRSIKGSLAQQASSERSRLLQGVPMLSRLSHHHRAMLADAMEMARRWAAASAAPLHAQRRRRCLTSVQSLC